MGLNTELFSPTEKLNAFKYDGVAKHVRAKFK